jgi:hypothetical protein
MRKPSILGARHFPIAVCVLAGYCVTVMAVFDVRPSATLLYLGFVLGFVLLPGTAAYAALTGRDFFSGRSFACGLAVGFTLEIGGSVSSRALGMPNLLFAYPAVATAVACLPLLKRTTRSREERADAPRIRPGQIWATVFVAIAAVTLLAERSFTAFVPPAYGGGGSKDSMWFVSMTAEAKHHWPLEFPNLSGVPVHYHVFSFVHLADASRATGITPYDLVTHIFPVLVLVAFLLQLAAVSARVFSSPMPGIVSGVVLYFVGPLDPWPTVPTDFFNLVAASSSFGLGLLIVVPLWLELHDVLVGSRPGNRALGSWMVVGLLMIGTAGAKSSALPVVATGLLLFFGFSLVTRRDVSRVVIAGALAGIVLVAAWMTLYRGSTVHVTLDVLGSFKHEEPFSIIHSYLPGPVALAVWPLAAAFGLTKLLLPGLLGVGLALRERVPRSWITTAFWLSPTAAGALFFTLLADRNDNQGWFLWTGSVGLAVIAGAGYWRTSQRVREALTLPRNIAVGTCVVALATLLIDSPLTPGPKKFWSRVSTQTLQIGRDPRYPALRWVAAHTSPSEVLMIPPLQDPEHCNDNAWAERRVMLGCDLVVVAEGSPFRTGAEQRRALPASLRDDYIRRMDLEKRVYVGGDQAAVQEAESVYGVRYLLVDRGVQAAIARRLAHSGVPAYRDANVTIIRLS